MIEVSALVITLISEAIVALLIIVSVGIFIGTKRKRKDRKAAMKLVTQIKKQSQTRLQQTGSFLSEKYSFDGDELKKAVKAIDTSEKKFMQKVINMYLKRDAKSLAAMDASVAELIDTYKSLSPIMPAADEQPSAQSPDAEELERLYESNARLTQELAKAKEAMNNMTAEFGNMFGGGQDHELAKHEVMDKVVEKKPEEDDDMGIEIDEATDDPNETESIAKAGQEIDVQVESEFGPEQSVKKQDDIKVDDSPAENEQPAQLEPDKQDADKKSDEEVVIDEELDDLLDGIDLSEDKE